MIDLINKLHEDYVIKSDLADQLQISFSELQLSVFQNVEKYLNSLPCGRRYTGEIKQFALTLLFPKSLPICG